MTTDDTSTGTQEPITLQPGTPEYDAAMVARFDRQTTPDTQVRETIVTPMPEGGQDKFYNAETGAYDWASHAKELQYKLEQRSKTGDTKAEDQQATADDAGTLSDTEGLDIITRAGLSVEELGTTIRDTGTVTAEQRAALNKQGLPDALIDSHIEAIQAQARAGAEAVFDHAGGEEAWNELSTWASQNLTDTEKTRYNEMLSSGEGTLVVDILKTKMAASKPTAGEGRLTTGAQSGTGGSPAYQSRQEMIRDMQKPEYRDDPAFRRKVHQRVAVSDFTSSAYTG